MVTAACVSMRYCARTQTSRRGEKKKKKKKKEKSGGVGGLHQPEQSGKRSGIDGKERAGKKTKLEVECRTKGGHSKVRSSALIRESSKTAVLGGPSGWKTKKTPDHRKKRGERRNQAE